MFGYISPDAPYLFIKDETLYKALYCGLCKSIKGECGNLARTALTYDMAFCAAVLLNVAGEDVKIKKRRCFFHIKSRRMAEDCDILRACARANTALAYFKLRDDKEDGDGRGALLRLYKKGYKRVLKSDPTTAEIVRRATEEQRALEEGGCAVIEAACEPSANALKALCAHILGQKSTEAVEELFFAVGKWVYLIDALDDYDKDIKKGAYNVFYKATGAPSKEELTRCDGDEIKFVFDSIFASMRSALGKIKFVYNSDLTDNIILRGIPLKTRAVFGGACKNGVNDEQKKS